MTRYLLDSHVVLWWQLTPDRLTRVARTAIASGHNHLYVSDASLWELTIKVSLGKLLLPEPLSTTINEMRAYSLPIAKLHIERVQHLPHLHGDPFDRMLIAQAQIEGLTLITRDRMIPRYDVTALAA